MQFLVNLLHSLFDYNKRTYKGDDTPVTLEDCLILGFCSDGVSTVQHELEDFGLDQSLGSISNVCCSNPSSFVNAAIELNRLRAGQIPGMLRLSKRLVWADNSLFFIAPWEWMNLSKWNSSNYDDYRRYWVVKFSNWLGVRQACFFDFFYIGICAGEFFAHTQVRGIHTQHWLEDRRKPAWYKLSYDECPF